MTALATGLLPAPVLAQQALDRVDPSRIEERVPDAPSLPSAAPAITAPRSATSSAIGEPITIGAITLSGLQVLRPSDFADLFETYVGRTLSPAALAGLADALADRMRARGFPFASATISPQALTAGVLTVRVDEGSVDGVRVIGATNGAVEAALQPLAGTGPVSRAQLERRLLIAGDVDGIWVKRSRLVTENGRRILQVEIGTDRALAVVGLDNSGTRPIGPIQADLTVRVSQIFGDDDTLTFSQVITAFEPSEFGFLRLRYGKRVTAGGTELSAGASFARIRPGSYLADREISGRSWTATLAVLHPLLRRRESSLWAEASLNVRDTEQERFDQLARRDRLSVFRTGLYGFTVLAGGRLRASATASQGLDLFDATMSGDPLASRGDADGTFTSLALAADWTGPVISDLSARVAISGQLAAQPLLVAEELGIGGGQFLRAYDYGERSGDQGFMAAAELRWQLASKVGPARKPQLYGFLDGGHVDNLRDGSGGGTLFSTGGGVRSTLGTSVDLDLNVAIPLSGDRYDSGNSAPVVNFRISKRF